MEKLPFVVDNQIVYVNYVKTNNKNMYLKVKRDQTLEVSAPKRVPEKDVRIFVEKHLPQFMVYLAKAKANTLYSLAKQFIYVDGIKYRIVTLTGFMKSKCHISGPIFYISTRYGTDIENDKAVDAFLKKHLQKYLHYHQPLFEQRMNIPPHAIRVTNKTSTWGTNNIRRRSISYALKLAHFNMRVIDYVIIHELAHHFVGAHNEEFWRIVALYMPNYQIYKKQLKNISSFVEE